jgi:hypothetical protein
MTHFDNSDVQNSTSTISSISPLGKYYISYNNDVSAVIAFRLPMDESDLALQWCDRSP